MLFASRARGRAWPPQDPPPHHTQPIASDRGQTHKHCNGCRTGRLHAMQDALHGPHRINEAGGEALTSIYVSHPLTPAVRLPPTARVAHEAQSVKCDPLAREPLAFVQEAQTSKTRPAGPAGFGSQQPGCRVSRPIEHGVSNLIRWRYCAVRGLHAVRAFLPPLSGRPGCLVLLVGRLRRFVARIDPLKHPTAFRSARHQVSSPLHLVHLSL